MRGKYILFLTFALIICVSCFPLFAQTANNFAADAADSVVTILLGDNGQANPVGSGLVVRPDGYVLTAYHLIKGAREIQIRFRNGEIYDHAVIISTDERRNVALLHINALGLRSIPGETIEESQVGAQIIVVANPAGHTLTTGDKILNSVQLADGISGAGRGFRVLQFDWVENAAGGLLLDENWHSLGIVTTNPDLKNQSVAVPLSSILGLIRSASYSNSSVYFSSSPSPQNTPYPIPQSSVQMPERGVTPLAPRGPGSVVIKPSSPKEILAASKTIYVASDTVFFKPAQLVNALNKRKEIDDWHYRLSKTEMSQI